MRQSTQRIGGEIVKNFTRVLLPAILALTLLGVSAPAVSATHSSSMFVVNGFTGGENWIDILSPCLAGSSDPLSYPANTLFFVSSGWGAAPWTEMPTSEKQGFMSETTRFTFLIDGQLQTQSRVYQYYKGPDPIFGIPDFMAKLYNTEYHDGLTGSHLFTGQFYLDASLFGGSFGEPLLAFECSTTVNFTA